jgi:hypothetical protein
MKNHSFQSNRFDWNQFQNLLFTSIRLDFRGSRGMLGRWKRMPAIWGSLIFYGFMGMSLAGGLFYKTTPFPYAVFILAYSMVMVAFAVMLEYDRVILQPEDELILGPLPVSSKTYLLAKFCNLMFYAILVGSSICLFPSILGVFLSDSFPSFSIAFFLGAVPANLFSAFFVAVIYGWFVRTFHPEQFRDVLVYLQIGITFCIIILYQLLPRAGDYFVQTHPDQVNAWFYVMPPAWFAGSVYCLLGSDVQGHLTLSLLGLFGIVLIVFLLYRQFYLNRWKEKSQFYNEKTIHLKEEGRSDLSLFPERVLEKTFGPSEITAGFQLTNCLIRSDRSVKMGMYPVFGIPLAFLALALLEGGLVDPFVANSFTGNRGTTTIAIFFVFFMIYFFTASVVYIRDWEAGWIYQITPINIPSRFYQGVKLAILLRLVFPFFVLLCVLYCIQIPLSHAIRHVLSLFLFCLVASSVVSLFIKDFPFSRRREKGEHIQRFGFILLVLPFFGVTMAVQSLAYQNNQLLWIIQGGLFVIFFILEIAANRRLNRVLKVHLISEN